MSRNFNCAFIKNRQKGSRNHKSNTRYQAKNFPNISRLSNPRIQTCLTRKDATSLSQETQESLVSKGNSKASGLSYFKVK